MQIVSTRTAEKNFYPTPDDVVRKMLNSVGKLDYVKRVLEPSAGTGNIVKALSRAVNHMRDTSKVKVDCIEIDPVLRQTLKWEFSEEYESEIKSKISNFDDRVRLCDDERFSREYKPLSRAEQNEHSALRHIKRGFENVDVRIVHDDFLTFKTFSRYDLIIMNPPFDKADEHLLKAIQLAFNTNCRIVCLMNHATLLNPYSETRKQLKEALEHFNAEVEVLGNVFTDAERSTDVEVAMVTVKLKREREDSEIFDRMDKAEERHELEIESSVELIEQNFIKNMVRQHVVEVKASLELIRQYENLKPKMLTSLKFKKSEKSEKFQTSDNSIIELSFGGRSNYWYSSSNNFVDTSEYLKKVRRKYWRALLVSDTFTNKLTSELRKKYSDKVESLSEYEFSEFNINQVLADINVEMYTGVEQQIMKLFDKLTAEHTYYPECTQNRHYFDGWKTNKAHAVGKKTILPKGTYYYNSWDKAYEFKSDYAFNALVDIEKTFDYLSGRVGEASDLEQITKEVSKGLIETKNVEFRYFYATFYKKGTIHLTYKDQTLIDRLNIYCAKGRNWLPPNYGKKKYSDLSTEEKATVDSFQGEKEYNKVMARPDVYLFNIADTKLLA